MPKYVMNVMDSTRTIAMQSPSLKYNMVPKFPESISSISFVVFVGFFLVYFFYFWWEREGVFDLELVIL